TICPRTSKLVHCIPRAALWLKLWGSFRQTVGAILVVNFTTILVVKTERVMALTVKRINKLLRQGKPGKFTDTGEVRGLMLCIDGPGSAHWLLRYQRDKKVSHMGLGSAADLTLAAARERARRERERLAAGVDPLELRRSERAAQAAANAKRLTFKEASERCHSALAVGWSDHHSHEFISSLRRWTYPLIGSLDVAAIGRDEVLRCLEQTARRETDTFWNTYPVTADRTRGRIERVLDWAQVRGYRAGDNPARWRNYLATVLPAPSKVRPTRNMAAVPYAEVPEVMATLAVDQ